MSSVTADVPNSREDAALPSLARVRRGLTWSVTGAILGQGGTFLGNILLANVLGRHSFGEFWLLFNTVTTLSGLAQISAGYTAAKYVAELRTSAPGRAGRIMGLCYALALLTGFAGAVVLLLFGKDIAAQAMKAAYLGPDVLILSPYVLLAVLSGCLSGILAGLEKFSLMARALALNGGAYFLLCGAGGYFGGTRGACAGLVAASLCQCLFLHYLVLRAHARLGIAVSFRNLSHELPIILHFLLPSTLASLSSLPAAWFANLCLARSPNGFAEAALFSASLSLKGLIMFLPNNLNPVTLSILNNQLGLGQKSQAGRIFLFGLVLNTTTVILGGFVLALLGPSVLRAYGKDFTGGQAVLIAVLLGAIPEALGLSLGQILQARVRLWLNFFLVVIPKDATIALLAIPLVRAYGGVGLACAYAAGASLAALTAAGVASVSWRERG